MSDAQSLSPRSSSEASQNWNIDQSISSPGGSELAQCINDPDHTPAASLDSEESTTRSDTKQRRKRTSPQDQAILEAYYKHNSKPNKLARVDIVEKVSLTEKEVQIWFQNRRQINRRKSRPLLPHEIAAFGLTGSTSFSSDSTSSIILSGSEEVGRRVLEGDTGCNQKEFEHSQKSDEISIAKTSASEATVHPSLKRQSSSDLLPLGSSLSLTEASVTKSFASHPGYLSNRWNTIPCSSSTPNSPQICPLSTPPLINASLPASCPERVEEILPKPSSHVRLSLSLDGKAELVSTLASPPKQDGAKAFSIPGLDLQRKSRGLQRSFSALPLGSRTSINTTTAPNRPRMPTGRSRDARTWEFACDGEARDELTLQAENESHGSAIAAISLIRTASNSILKASTNKRNVQPNKQEAEQHSKKPKLGRAMSSLARLQNPLKSFPKLNQQPSDKSKDGLMCSPNGDSDKENWLPNDGGSNVRRRPLPASRSYDQNVSRQILSETISGASHTHHVIEPKSRRRRGENTVTNIFEDQENTAVGDEVEKFMRGEISPSKKGDLDCVQGLLSLSQGNWR